MVEQTLKKIVRRLSPKSTRKSQELQVRPEGGLELGNTELFHEVKKASFLRRGSGETFGEATSQDTDQDQGQKWLFASFAVLVLLPCFVYFVYASLFASPEFESKASFAVRSSEGGGVDLGGIANIGKQLAGMSSNSQDAFIVLDYLKSKSMISDLGGAEYLEEHYAGEDTDFWGRMPRDATIERAHDYASKKIQADIDTRSNIVTVSVRSYSSASAKQITEDIMELTDQVINDLSLAIRNQKLELSQAELERSETNLKNVLANLSEYRRNNETVDPVGDTERLATLIAELSLKEIETRLEYESLQGRMSADSPSLQIRFERLTALSAEIDSLNERLLSQNGGSEQLTRFELLKTEEEFAQKLYEISTKTHEAAMRDASSKKLFLIKISRPILAQTPKYPAVVSESLTVFAFALCIWMLVVFSAAIVRENSL